jgi:hypothetical protein
MAKYFLIEPEVAGELGADTVMDSSVHPPRVSELHHELKGCSRRRRVTAA